jgi:hypothetical protein
MRWRAALAAAVILLLVAPGTWAQEGRVRTGESGRAERATGAPARGTRPVRDAAESRPQARRMSPAERWAALTPDRKAELRARWSKVRELGPEERNRLRRVATRLRELERGLPAELDAATRERLQALPSSERRAVVRDLVLSRAASEARSALRHLPSEVAGKLDELPPEERHRALERARESRLERLLGAMVGQPERFGLDAELVAPLGELPLEARKQSLLLLLRERVLGRLEELEERPEGLDRSRLEQLEPEAFARGLLRYLEANPEARSLLVEGRGGPSAGQDAGRRPGVRRLHTALEVQPEDLLPEGEASPRDRRRHALHRQRGRVLRVLEEEALVPPAELEQLRAAPDQEVVRFAGRFAAGRSRGRGGPRGR